MFLQESFSAVIQRTYGIFLSDRRHLPRMTFSLFVLFHYHLIYEVSHDGFEPLCNLSCWWYNVDVYFRQMFKSKTDISYSATTFTSYNSSITDWCKALRSLLTKKNVWCDNHLCAVWFWFHSKHNVWCINDGWDNIRQKGDLNTTVCMFFFLTLFQNLPEAMVSVSRAPPQTPGSVYVW